MATARYAFHGLIVESDLPLPATRVAGQSADVVVGVSSRGPIAIQPEWETWAAREDPFHFRVYRSNDGFVVDSVACQFHVSRDLRGIEARPRPDTPPDLVPLLLIGTALTALVTLRGGVVLHASAVVGPSGAVAIAGAPGAGKSTVAALLRLAGCTMLADDALHVEEKNGAWIAHAGAFELRLRPHATDLAAKLHGLEQHTSVDGRLVVRADSPALAGPAPLELVAFPRCVDGVFEVIRLRQQDVVLRLLSNLRIGSWCAKSVLAELTRTLAALARSVAGYELVIPRSALADEDFAVELAASLEARARAGFGAA